MIEVLKRAIIRKDMGASLEPVSRVFGLDRGLPIDRYYIQKFLAMHGGDIKGNVLEVGDASYTRKYGHLVTKSDVLNYTYSPGTTITDDLATGNRIPHDVFDCIILTQTLPFIYDVKAAIATCYNALKPNGVLLVTVPGISQISRYDMERWGDYWRFTSLSLSKLLTEKFEDVNVKSYGNVYAARCFLEGICTEELFAKEIEHVDRDYELLITARCVK